MINTCVSVAGVMFHVKHQQVRRVDLEDSTLRGATTKAPTVLTCGSKGSE